MDSSELNVEPAVCLTTRDPGRYSRPTVPTLTDEAAWRLGHDVPPVPAGQPAPRQVLFRLRSPPRAHLRLLWRRTTRGRPLLSAVRQSCHRWHGGPGWCASGDSFAALQTE